MRPTVGIFSMIAASAAATAVLVSEAASTSSTGRSRANTHSPLAQPAEPFPFSSIRSGRARTLRIVSASFGSFGSKPAWAYSMQ